MAKVTWMRQNGVIKASWRASSLGEVLDNVELTDAPNWRTAPEPKQDTTVSDPLLGDDQPPAQEQPQRTTPRATSRLIRSAGSQPE